MLTARSVCVCRDCWWEICQGREAMFRRPKQDRMTPLCIDHQLAIDAEHRRGGKPDRSVIQTPEYQGHRFAHL